MRAGDVFDDRFSLEKRIGAGGMGTVWRAFDRATSEFVALKVLRDPEGDGAQRFLQEARILATFEHPHVVRHVAHGIAKSGEPYLAMEYLEGESLLARLERGPLDFDQCVMLCRHVADALGAAHARRILHRDIKPSNLFLAGGLVDGVKIVDFGIARTGGATSNLTRTGSILGTPGYMSPEQARGDRDADARSDVFALGCVLFECLTGQPPFQGAHVMALLAKLLFDEPPRLSELRPDVPEPLAALCTQMIAKDPDLRPENGAAVLGLLERIEAGPKSMAPTTEVTRVALTGSERRLVSIVAASPPVDCDMDADLINAVRRVAVPLGARVSELSSGAIVAVLLGEGSIMDQAAAAARCALWVKLAVPEAAVVLVTGRGESTNRLPVGEALERAAALLDQALATTGEHARVWIDASTHALLDTRFDVVVHDGRQWLRGEHQTIQENRTLLGKSSPFVGREREMRNIVDLIDDSIDERRPAAVLVTSSPGMGKSRLRQEVVRTVTERHPDVALTMARPDAFSTHSAYSLLSGALRNILQISAGEPIEAQRRKIELLVASLRDEAQRRTTMEFLGELAGAPFPDDDSPRLRAARHNPQLMADQIAIAYCTITAAVAATRPVLMVLEDLHWGDASSMKILTAVLRDLKDLPIVILAFARPSVHEVFPNLLESNTFEEIRLKPLTRRAATELVSTMLGNAVDDEGVQAIVERAEGNAFFLEELIRAVADKRTGELPSTVLGMVEARLAALAPAVRRLLRAASIFGEVFWENGVAELLGEKAPLGPHLADLCSRELIVRRLHSRFAGQDEYAFRHAIIREGAYAMLAERDMRLGHQLAGTWLKQAGELDSLVLAEHFHRGQDLENAAIHYLRAGSQAFDRDDLAGALLSGQRGLACGMSGEIHGNLQTLLAMTHCWRSELVLAHQASLAASHLVAKGSRWECLLLFHGTWAALVVGAEDDFTAMAHRFAEFQPDPDVRRDYLFWAPLAASLLTSYGREHLCRRLLDRTDELAQSTTARDLGLVGAISVGRSDYVRAFGRTPFRQLELTRRAVEAFESIGDTRNQITALNRYGQALGEIGDIDAGERALREAVSLAHRIRGPFAALQSALHLAALLVGTNTPSKWDAADAIATDVLGTANLSAGYRAWALGIQAQVLLSRGAYEQAVEQARAAQASCIRLPLRLMWIRTVLVRGLLGLGRTTEASSVAAEINGMLDTFGGGYVEISAWLAMAETHASCGDMNAARGCLARCMQCIDTRAADIADETMRRRYLHDVLENARARELAGQWL